MMTVALPSIAQNTFALGGWLEAVVYVGHLSRVGICPLGTLWLHTCTAFVTRVGGLHATFREASQRDVREAEPRALGL